MAITDDVEAIAKLYVSSVMSNGMIARVLE
jgi:hypothetical protein